MTSPVISVIIPVKNAGSVFKESLSSITSNREADYEVIVIDDHSTDTSGAIARHYSCQVITLQESLGPAYARNIGAQAAKGEILLFIDSDIIVPPDTLRKVSLIFQDHSIIAIVGVLTEEIRFKNFCSQYKNLWMRYTYIRMPETVSLFYTSCAAIRREIFLKSGGFDPGYWRPSVEDTAFGQKLEMLGYKVHLRSDIEVEHVKYYSFLEILKTDFYRSADLLKMTLRNGLRKLLQSNTTSVPSAFMMGVPLFLSSIPLGLIYCFVPHGRLFSGLLFVLIFCVFLFLNRTFWFWLKSQRGLLFSLQMVFYLLLDIPIATVGIIYGIIDYARGRHY